MIHQLKAIVGADYASDAIEDRISYSRDMVSPLSGEFTPDYVVLPRDVAQIQKVIQLANARRVPVYPVTFGTNVAGFALPVKGGIVLGLKRLDQIIKIDTDAMSAIIEPGVTWRRLAEEAARVGLQPTFPIGPYSGSPIGSFVLWNITGHAGRFGADRVVSLEAVLPNGEVLRTASAAMPGHETLNPFCRYAYGPDITGLFRGSLGAYGIVTKVAYQLYPVGETEKHVDLAFEDPEAMFRTMKAVERYDFTKFCLFFDGNFMVNICAPDVEQLRSRRAVQDLRKLFPPWVMTFGLSGPSEIEAVHEKIILEEAERNGGCLLDLGGNSILQNKKDDLIPGASHVITRMYEPHGGAASVVAVAPLRSMNALLELAKSLVREFDLKDPLTGDHLELMMTGYPYDRARNVYLEVELSFDPSDVVALKKMKEARRAWTKRMIPLGGSLMMLSAAYSRLLLPSYTGFLANLKTRLDPNNVLSPHKLVD